MDRSALPHTSHTVAVTGSLDELLPPWLPAVMAIVERGLWCVVEACMDVSAQRWEPILIICERNGADSAISIAECIDDFPACDLRVAGYARDTLSRVEQAPTALCHLGGFSRRSPATAQRDERPHARSEDRMVTDAAPPPPSPTWRSSRVGRRWTLLPLRALRLLARLR